MEQQVIIATPSTLLSLLRTVSYAWKQEALADNARIVFDLGRELYDRLGTLGAHVDKLGRSISGVVKDYNTAVGSLESRVLSSARKLKELKFVDETLAEPRALDASMVRPLVTSAELDPAERAARARRSPRSRAEHRRPLRHDVPLALGLEDEDSAAGNLGV